MHLVIGDDDTLHHPARSNASLALASLISASRRRLWLRVPTLDGLTGNAAVCDAVKVLALSNARADIRILFDSIENAVPNGHRLVHLSRRLPSRITLRQTQPDDNDAQQCFAIGDNSSLFEASGWPRPARLDLSGHRLPQAPRLAQQFLEHWARGRASTELRELRL
jgi:hypothetical protein